MKSNTKGIVYVLTNPAMPKIVKIGLTTRGDIEQRMRELFTTGVPVPFECVFACDVDNCEEVVKALHIAFGPNRINPKREFFSIESEQPIAILRLFQKKDVTEQVNKEIEANTTDIDREAGEKLKRQKRPSLNFAEMNIPVGSILVFIDDDINAEAVVSSDKKVTFKGNETSLTFLTKQLRQLDYSIQPTPHWTFNGRLLIDIYNDIYSED